MTTPLRGNELALPLWRNALRERDLEMLRRYKLGLTAEELMLQFRLSRPGIHLALRRVGKEWKAKPRVSFDTKERIVQKLRDTTQTWREIATAEGVDITTVKRIRKRYNLPHRLRGRKPRA